MILFLSIMSMVVALVMIKADKVRREKLRADKRRRNSAATGGTLVMVLSGAFFLSGLTGMAATFFSSDAVANPEVSGEKLFASHGYAVAEKLAGGYKNEKILLVVRNNESARRVDRLKEAIASRLGSAAEIEIFPVEPAAARNYEPEDMPDFHVMVKAKDFDPVVAQTKDTPIVILACELPKDAARMKLWKQAQRKKIFVLNSPFPLDDAVAGGLVAGYTILDKAAAEKNLPIPNDYGKAFASRFKIVARI